MAENIINDKDLETVTGGTNDPKEHYTKHEIMNGMTEARKFKDNGGNLADFQFYMKSPKVAERYGVTYGQEPEYYIYFINYVWEMA